MFFDNWAGLARVLIVGTCAYVALIVLLRVTGKRTLSKLNAFDLIVTVALGSTLATVLLSQDVALAEGILAFALLIFLQFGVTWLSVRSSFVWKIVKSEPTLIFHKGSFLEGAMKRERVTEDEVRAAIRAQGSVDVEDVEAVVLETDGSLTVLQAASAGAASRSSLKGVTGYCDQT